MTDSPSTSRYSEAGVDIDKGNAFISRIKNIVADTHGRGVLSDIGGFSGLFAIGNAGYEDPVLIASTDGVGTKLNIAKMCNRHDTIGIDLVAMCVNDVVVSGAKPLFFLDYFAVSSLDLDVATDVVKGIAKGCKISGCSLIGGETAEMPGLYQPGDYDLAGFVVGIADRNSIIDGSDIRVGNKIIGLASSGLHSNGYSLVRKIFFEELGLSVDDQVEELGCTVGEELLRPTRIYVQSLLKILRNFKINGLIHNTGGGFIDNVPRILPGGCKAVIEPDSWDVPPIFTFLQDKGNISIQEMYRTFNMGIGMMALVDADLVEDVVHQFKALGETPYVIGEITKVDDTDGQWVTIDGITG
ncbi:phosphoribosylformylglycinamidine cyclo-ligase [Desulfolithobacter dissulfuricans]|uniref:Phosphoribosylformylglycinamidine cyclo-ligase n=1 Tax=Desulfolithobacter dissulfuricans TaxID=2795293 RepID=A0A915TZR4_9BACT|nr:phosphoribosylformylglycinamidine cyclo-ligase [Desulfolithobacter dissulfuricans]BCO08903.1 phosphoribosylformylglycinamidine cyclo-ligase [Desulfolithobacter dissulfuricans]